MHVSYYKRPLLVFLIFYVIFFAVSALSDIPRENDDFENFSHAAIIGRVSSNPQTKNDKTTAIIKFKNVNDSKLKGNIYAVFPAGHEINYLDEVKLEGTVRRPYSPDITGNFNWRKYLQNKDVFWEINADEITVVRPAPLPISALNKLRGKILKLFKESFDSESAIILSGITLGDKATIPTDLRKAFNDSGAMHLLVASGANVGFVCVIIYYLCMLAGIKYNWRLPLALAAAGVYTILAGADAPLVRAYLMTICAGLGLKTGRNSGAFHGLVLAAFIILVISPKSIFDVGFQMSFLATFIILLSVSTFKIPAKWPRVIKVILEIFLITTAVQLVLLPIYANVFYRFSFTALISNIFLVPLSGVLMGLGFLLFILHVIKITFLFKLFWYITFALLEVFKWLVNFFSSFSFSAVTMPALSPASTAGFYVSLFFIYNLKMFKHKKIIFASLCVILLFCVLVNPFKYKNFIYLFNANGKNANIINIDGKTFVIHDGFNENILQNALLGLGRKKADIEISPTPKELGKKEIIPFAGIWPGEIISYKNINIEALWGISGSETKRWNNLGYSGTDKDCISFNFSHKNTNFTTACENKFILRGENYTPAARNGSKIIRL
ncbi:competence protein ComEC [Elusimicrobium posterum]|uniref:ComEC/Rec2 family competence protein n=1 Tax=Elusimicrobium posterum TaxID=3116653 RepID=UPI003C77F244